MELTRVLSLQTPPISGEDVAAAQKRLIYLGFTIVGAADGLFGENTDKAVRSFQKKRGLQEDGKIGPNTWKSLFTNPHPDTFKEVISYIPQVIVPHNFRDSISWQLANDGIRIASQIPEITGGEPDTVARVWGTWGSAIQNSALKYGVPVELIIATICTETTGNPDAIRQEPGYVSDEATPHKVSPGIMQTLISTARIALKDDSIDRDWLLVAANSIEAGTAYIGRQKNSSRFDPPKVACAYNAGGIYYNKGANNRWKMRQYPLGSGEHADRYVKWFNDCFRFFQQQGLRPEGSYFGLVGEFELSAV